MLPAKSRRTWSMGIQSIGHWRLQPPFGFGRAPLVATSVDPSHALWWMNPTWKPSFASLFLWFDTIAHMWNECLLSFFKLVRESVEIDNRLTIGRRFFVLIPHCHQSFHCLDRFCTSLRFQSRPIYTSSIRLYWQQCKNLTKGPHCGPKLSEIAFKEILGCMPVVLKTMM